MEPRDPKITVRLTGTDGKAIAIVIKVRTALQQAGVPQEELRAFTYAAMRGTYQELLCTCAEWVQVC